jgi:hypothetical protein
MNEELKVIIRAELAQFKKAMEDAVSGLRKVSNEGKKASKDMDGFLGEVNRQSKALSELKQQYINLAQAHGKESKAAKEAAEQIRKLSTEYRTNKTLAAQLGNEANSFDMSLISDDTSHKVDETNASLGELQGTLSDIAAMNVFGFVSRSFDDWKDKAKNMMAVAKDSFADAKTFFGQAVDEFRPDSEYLVDIGQVGQSFTDAAKGSALNVKYMFESLGNGISATFKAVGAAIAASLAVVATVIIGIIALTKNALNQAKQIKAEAAQASKLGLTTQAYQEWGYVMKQVGIEADKLADFIKTLSDEQNNVRDGAEDITKAFESIGLSAEEVMGMSQEQLFTKTVEGLQGIENQAERTSIAYRIFGEDASELANILYLNNEETKSLISNYYALGAAPSDNLIQKSKVLEASVVNLSYAWSGLKNTLAEAVAPAVIWVIQALTTAIAYINAFLRGVLGVGFVKETTDTASKGFNEVSGGIGAVGSAAKDAAGAVKELMKYTMGFDELNIIPKEQDASGGGGGGYGSSVGGGFSSAGIDADLPIIETPDISAFEDWVEEYREVIQDITTWSLLGIGVLMAVAGFMGGNIPLALSGIALAGLGIGIGAIEGSTWDRLGKKIKGVWDDLKSWFNTNVKPIFTKGWWEEMWNNLLIDTELVLYDVKEAILEWWGNVESWYDFYIAPIFTLGFWANLWNNLLLAAENKLAEIKSGIVDKWDEIKIWFNTYIKPIFTKQYWLDKWETIRSAAAEKLGGVKQKVEEKWNGLKTWYNQNIKPKFTVEYWKGVFGCIKDGMKEAMNGLIYTVETGINYIVGKLNTVRFTVPDWIPKVGGKSWGISLPYVSIPRLESGGIATQSILANIGERGKEAVLPLENHTEWMDTLADRIASRNNTPSKIVLMVDGTELGYASINSINSITRQTGTLQLQLI